MAILTVAFIIVGMSTMATDGIIYSPVSKMDITSLNEKALHALKYHQLLKLSSKYNIKKRWAKKDDLVKSLLAIRDSLEPSFEALDNTINEELEWTDGKEALKNLVPPSQGNKKISRSTFTIQTIDLDDSRATFNIPKNTEVFPGLSNLDPRLTFDVPKKPLQTEKAKVKMLTVPGNRPVARTVGNKSKSVRESPLKMSNRSITIKKAKDMMSPMKAARSLLSNKTRTPILQSPAPVSKPVAATRKENLAPQPERRLSNRRKSKSDDPEARRRSGLDRPACASFRTPPVNTKKERPQLLTGVKPITVTKMPNFAAIHQKQFSKMDSLDEYINKKSDRVKKLFGTPMSSRPYEKEESKVKNTKLENVKEEVSFVNAFQHQKHPKTKLEAAKNIVNRKQLQTRTEVKDRNRSHIHGIRSNRRFELQMKFRNL